MNHLNFIGRIILSVKIKQLVAILFLFLLPACSDVQFSPAFLDLQRDLAGQFKTESFRQGYVGKKLDILFVVDNSGSMADEQAKMGDRIDSFISTLYDVDWQIGITTTDVSDGQHGIKGGLLTIKGTSSYILTPKTPNYMGAFKSTVVREESINCNPGCGSGDEQALQAAIMAIEKRNAENKGFFRNDADLGLVILTDEDEKSTGPSTATSPESVVNKVRDTWGDSKLLLTYGMIIIPGDSQCYNSQNGAGRYGSFVHRLAMLTGGLTGSICANDYAPTLGLIGDHARTLLQYVQLQLYPEEMSIEVKFTPSHNTTWRLDGRRLYFDVPPPKETKIDVGYIVKDLR